MIFLEEIREMILNVCHKLQVIVPLVFVMLSICKLTRIKHRKTRTNT